MMMFIVSILSVILVDKFFLSLMDEEGRKKKILYLSPQAFLVGGITLFSLWISKASPWLSILSTVILMVVMAGLLYVWCYSGRTLKQFFWFVVLEVIYAVLLLSATSRQDVWPAVYAVVSRLPWITGIAAIATGAVWTLRRKALRGNENYGYAAIAVAVIAIAVVAAIGAPAALNAAAIAKAASAAAAEKAVTTVKAKGEPPKKAETATATVAVDATAATAEKWYQFYNDDVQDDGIDNNDFNFGPDPFVEGKKADYYLSLLTSKMMVDPSLTSAEAVSLDSYYETDFIGEILYTGNVNMNDKLNQLKRADAATTVLMGDEALNRTVQLAIQDYMMKGFTWTVEYRKNFTDMVYMVPNRVLGHPNIVLYESDVKEGWCLVGTPKAEKLKKADQMVFHIKCGFQLVNGAKALGVKPQANPQAKSTNNQSAKPATPAIPTNPPAVPTYEPEPEPTYTPEPTPGPTKDPSQSNNSGGNDVSGTNENTSTGVGGNESSRESIISSQDKQEYQQAQQHVQEANNSGQREAGDSIAPSTTTPPDVQDIRNDGAKEIEKPATETKPVESQSGSEIPKDNDGSWSGPTD